jgi:hypothetical protein
MAYMGGSFVRTTTFIIQRCNNSLDDASFYISAVCTVPNPYGCSFYGAIECYKNLNAPFLNGSTAVVPTASGWNIQDGDYHNEVFAQIAANSNFVGCIRTPWCDISEVTDAYVGIIALNGTGAKDGLVFIGLVPASGSANFKILSPVPKSASAKTIRGIGVLRMPYELFFTKAELPASNCIVGAFSGQHLFFICHIR